MSKIKRYFVDVIEHETPVNITKGNGTAVMGQNGPLQYDKEILGVTRGSRSGPGGAVSYYSQLTLRAEDGSVIQIFDKTGNIIRQNVLVRQKKALAGVEEVPAGATSF